MKTIKIGAFVLFLVWNVLIFMWNNHVAKRLDNIEYEYRVMSEIALNAYKQMQIRELKDAEKK